MGVHSQPLLTLSGAFATIVCDTHSLGECTAWRRGAVHVQYKSHGLVFCCFKRACVGPCASGPPRIQFPVVGGVSDSKVRAIPFASWFSGPNTCIVLALAKKK